MYSDIIYYISYQSSAPVELTEAETEYAVNVVKHIFDTHVVFQYNCTNTIPEQLLEDVMTNIDDVQFHTIMQLQAICVIFFPIPGYCSCGCFRSRRIFSGDLHTPKISSL